MKKPVLTLLLLAGVSAVPAAAQDALEEARAQYEAAAYEEALATLTRVGDSAPAVSRVELEQYRALCLIALGHLEDAEKAVATLVAADPTYLPSPDVASPKVLSVVADIRKRHLPTVARGLLDSGRTAFQKKDLAAAQRDFSLLLKLLDDPAMAGRDDNEDLRTIAQGFVTLSAASSAAPPRPTTPEPAPAATPARTSAAPQLQAGRTASAASSSGAFEPAVAVEQTLPEWIPPTVAVGRFEYNGKLKVRIGLDGRVLGASIEQPSHPAYDARLVQVARDWRYRPATRDGVPVESERVIAIQLRAQP